MLFPGLDLSGIIPNSIFALHICAVCRYIFTSYKPFNAFFATGSVIVIVGVAVTFSFDNIAVPRASLFSVRRGLDWPRGFPLRTRAPARVNVVVGFSPFNLLQYRSTKIPLGFLSDFLPESIIRLTGSPEVPVLIAHDPLGMPPTAMGIEESTVSSSNLNSVPTIWKSAAVQGTRLITDDCVKVRGTVLPGRDIAQTDETVNSAGFVLLVVTTDRTYRTPSVSRSVR